MSSPSGEAVGFDGRAGVAAAMPERIVGLDLARFIAIVGMIATHVWLYSDLTAGTLVAGSALFEGRASALFAVLAGVGVVLATRRAMRERRHASARLMVFGRGAALIVIGLTLDLVDVRILVILVYYGVMFWLIAPLVAVPTWVLGVLTGVVAVGAPVVAWLVGVWTDPGSGSSPVSENVSWLDLRYPLQVLHEVLFTGAYPALIWLAYGLAGVLVGRAVLKIDSVVALRRNGLSIALAGGLTWVVGVLVSLITLPAAAAGAAAAAGLPVEEGLGLLLDDGGGQPSAASAWYLLSPAAHSGSTVDLLLTGGFAVTAIGLLLLLGSVLGPVALKVLTPVIGAGRAPLTSYTAHVLLVAVITGLLLPRSWSELTYPEFVALGTPWYISSFGMFALNVGLVLAIGTVLMLLRRRGPLETFVTWAGRAVGRLGGAGR
ncbi:DUF1624 domain-containing protein [Herbiconiux daphne]|uniref:DUF1624 domain-containing protein n=1 Tax=Herbiconiux daphne TaxID=2970914 RepID=A0ABT2H6J6_9MICO|nr:DUF1624 domain-containing protein [Herbiconiux daphne]MCS5735561.1 DUF1624 domain-containing protein [Herbiconiux daphne]